MSKEKIIKCIVMNTCIALIDIVIFSPGLLDFQLLKGSAFERAIAGTAIIVSAILLLAGNYIFFFKSDEQEGWDVKELKQPGEYIWALKKNKNKVVFQSYIETAVNQVEQFVKKKEHIKEVLMDRFDEHEMSYAKFIQTIEAVEQLFFNNLKEAINKMNIYDETNETQTNMSDIDEGEELLKEKNSIHEAYRQFVKQEIKENEVLLLKIDKLLLELSKINITDDINELSIVKELDELIQNTEHYK